LIRGIAKGLRIAAKVAVVALAAITLLLGVTWTFLQTRRGGELVRRVALPRVNAALAGTITLDRFAFGGDRVTLEDLALYDPEGQFVGRVEHVDVWFSPLALLRRHVDVRAVEIRRPELALVQDSRGLNLARALAPPQPGAAAPAPTGESAPSENRIAVDVHALAVTGGVIDYRASVVGGQDRRVHVAEVSIHGQGSLAGAHASAEVAIRARGGRVDARGELDTRTRQGQAKVHAAVQGLGLDADGKLDGDRIAAQARVDATDLGVMARALAHDFALDRLPLSGHGRVDVEAGGTLAAPAIRVSARFPSLGFEDKRVRDLEAHARIPDLGAPDSFDLDARASSVALGAQHLRAPVITARTAGRRVTAHAAIAGPQPLSIDLGGTRDPRDRRTFLVDALEVRYPEATWTLRRRAHLSLADGISLSGFELATDGQRLAIDLRAHGDKKTAHVVVSRLDLGRLPRALVDPALGLGGVVDADIRAEDGARPRVQATAKLAGGRIHGHRDLSLDLQARIERGRAHGGLTARAPGVAATARFDLPGEWPPRNKRAPIALDVEVDDTDLAAVAKTVADTAGQKVPRLAGHARASIKIDGRVGEPRAEVSLTGRGLAFEDRRIGDLDVKVNGEGDGKITAQLTSTAPVRARVDLTTDLSLSGVLRRPPTVDVLERTPFEIKGTLDRVPLADLARAAGYASRVGGTLSSQLSVTGTAAEPHGTVAVDIAGATGPRFPPTDARIEVDLDGGIAARVRVVRKRHPLLALESRVGVPVGRLLDRTQLATAPIELRAVFGPYVMQRLDLQSQSSRDAARALRGRLHADLTVEGTLGAPRALFHAQASDVFLDKQAVGYAQVEARYADRQAKVDARLSSANGGGLHATAGMKVDLGYPAVTHGVDVRRAPFDARLEAQQFELRGLSGVTPQIRTIAGLLTASLTVQGTAAAPRLDGRLEWKDGVLGVTEFGEYRDIHLALHGDDKGIVLDELKAANGSGHARLTGTAKRAGGNAYDITADAKLDHLPIYKEGQPLAVVSLTSRIRGHAMPLDTKLDVDIEEARIELPDTKRRELQPLAEPHDIILMDGGKPLNREQAAKLKALEKAASAPARQAPARPPSLRLKVNSPRHLWVTGKDTYLELGLSRDFRVKVGEATQVFGQVTVLRGRIDLYGRRFDLKADSTLTFGGSPEHPDLDVRAEHVNTTENVTVLITAKGPIDKLTLTVTSPNRPELSESQLYTLIISGHLQLGSGGAPGASPANQAASLVGGFLASKLQSALTDRLPFDVLTIDVGSEGLGSTKFEAGRYLTDRFYVGYVGRVAADPSRYQNRNAVHLEFQITSRWEIEAEYGDLGTATGDLVWKKSY